MKLPCYLLLVHLFQQWISARKSGKCPIYTHLKEKKKINDERRGLGASQRQPCRSAAGGAFISQALTLGRPPSPASSPDNDQSTSEQQQTNSGAWEDEAPAASLRKGKWERREGRQEDPSDMKPFKSIS